MPAKFPTPEPEINPASEALTCLMGLAIVAMVAAITAIVIGG